MAYQIGQAVIVVPQMTPMARHWGKIVRQAKHGWRVEFDAWGVHRIQTLSDREIHAID